LLRFLVVFFLAGLMSLSVYAESGPLSGSMSGQGVDDHLRPPQIIVRPVPSGRVEEYRSGGQLYMLKITPEKGQSYYLVDSDGDGRLETRRAELDSDFVIPHWVLKRW